jgi:biopolymer transport protein ExbD
MLNGLRKSPEGEINITPMIDILLVLIIIFMVLQQPSKGERVEIPQPGSQERQAPQVKDIVVHLHDNGFGKHPTLKINDDEVSWEELEPRLQKILLARADRVAFVRGDPELEFEFVAQAVELTRTAGASRVGLLGPKD